MSPRKPYTYTSHGVCGYRIGVKDGNITRDASPYGHFDTSDRGAVTINGERFRCFQRGAPQGYTVTLSSESPGYSPRYRDPETGHIIERTPDGDEVAILVFDWREGVKHLYTPDGLIFRLTDDRLYDRLFSGKTEYGSVARWNSAFQVILDKEIPESEHGALVALLAFSYLQGDRSSFLYPSTR